MTNVYHYIFHVPFIPCSIVFHPKVLCFSGEQLLMAGEVFTIRPLQLYAVTQQLLQGKPTCANGDAKTDLGHILDFTCRLKYLKVSSVLNRCLCCQPSVHVVL